MTVSNKSIFRVCEQISGSDTRQAVAMQTEASILKDPEFVLNLVFMYEYSQLLTYSSTQVQDSHHLPVTRKKEIDALLQAAHESFAKEEYPEIVKLSWLTTTVCEIYVFKLSSLIN